MNKDIDGEIHKLKEQLSKWPYTSNDHDKLIDILRVDRKGKTQDLHEARQNKAQYFTLSTKDIVNWLQDLQAIEDNNLRIKSILEFYRIVIHDYPTAQYWGRCLDFVLNNYNDTQNIISELIIKELFKEALNDTVHDFKNSKEIWETVLAFFNNALDISGNEADFDTLLKLHLKRISYPHESIRESFSQLSGFISKYDSKKYEQHMLAANKVFSKTLKAQRYYEEFEIGILKNPNDVKVWIDYMELVNKYAKGIDEVSVLFYRAITSDRKGSVDDPRWVSIWLAYIYILYQEEIDVKSIVLEPVLFKFVRSYPGSAVSYAEYIRNCPIFENGVELFSNMKTRALQLDLMNSNSYDDWKVLALAILSYEFSLVHSGENIDMVADLYTDAADYVDIALENNNDVFHSVEKLVVSIYETLDDPDMARKVLMKLLENFSDQCEIWLYSYEFERRNHSSYELISKLLERAVDNSKTLDWPERIMQEWLSFEQIQGNIHSYERALIKVDKVIREMSLKRMHIQEAFESESTDKIKRNIDDDEGEQDRSNKRQRRDSMNETTRNREEYSVKISNLPQNISEEKLKKFFDDCGTPKEIKLFQEDGKAPEAIIEWTDSKEVFASLTKNIKLIDGNEVSVIRMLGSTLWVSNFPPSFSHERVKNIFEQVGTVVSIRFPSLKLNQSRRFCYVEYASPELAHLAILNYQGKEFEDEISNKRYRLVVDMSKPNSKKTKTDTAITEREIYIQNLNFKTTTESDLESLFQTIGTIDSVKVPLNEKMKNQGNINNGYAFVVFKSEVAAKNALQLNGTTLHDRKILVSQSQAKKHNNKSEKDPAAISNQFEELSTISIFNVSDTINRDQMTAFLTKRVGPVRHVEVFPNQEAALAEFEVPSDAGKASLILTSEEFEGKLLNVGLKSDLTRTLNGTKNVPTKKPKLMVPPTLQRRVRKK
jgi:RNA recognition motif-containing protein